MSPTRCGNAAPAPDAPGITLGDDGLTVAGGLPGEGLVRVDNEGGRPHGLTIYRVADGSTYLDVERALTTGTPPADAPPFSPAGGVTMMSPGRVAGLDLHLAPGTYALVSRAAGSAPGDPVPAAMVREVEISLRG